jgi:ubiquinone/menaquinone biosynthesis C-methylase UbiE
LRLKREATDKTKHTISSKSVEQTMAQYIHGNTDPKETRRLDVQADFVASFTFSDFNASPGMRVLDLATGVGAMAKRLLRHFPGIELTGVDASADQLAAARLALPQVNFVLARAEQLPFADETFDRIHCSWLLEHVSNAKEIVRESCRVLKRGGFCQFIEVDNASLSLNPLRESVFHLMRVLNAAQVKAGGDPLVGQRLHHIFHGAGFRRFVIQPKVLNATAQTPVFLGHLIEEFVGIFESVDESIGPDLAPLIAAAVADLKALAVHPQVRFRYVPVLVQGYK